MTLCPMCQLTGQKTFLLRWQLSGQACTPAEPSSVGELQVNKALNIDAFLRMDTDCCAQQCHIKFSPGIDSDAHA